MVFGMLGVLNVFLTYDVFLVYDGFYQGLNPIID